MALEITNRVTSPRVIVVGTGRSGTQTITQLLNHAGLHAQHEPQMFRTVPMAFYHVHRVWPVEDITQVLRNGKWPEAVVDFKHTELISLTADLWPDCKYVWVIRNARETVASMVAQNWYNPADDDAPPWLRMWWDTPKTIWRDVHYEGHRTRPDRLGIMSEQQWAGMSQPERCCWWWAHSTKVAASNLKRLAEDRWWAGRIEDLNVQSLLEFVHAPNRDIMLPHEGRTGAGWDVGWEPFWQKWCADIEEQLGYVTSITGGTDGKPD